MILGGLILLGLGLAGRALDVNGYALFITVGAIVMVGGIASRIGRVRPLRSIPTHPAECACRNCQAVRAHPVGCQCRYCKKNRANFPGQPV